jgi:hypothetical protein
VAERDSETRRSSQPHSRSRLQGRSRAPGRRGRSEPVEGTKAQRLADSGWIEWGGELIWVAGYTSGGAPYGLRVCDFDRADLEAMGLDIAALHDAGLLTPPSEPSDEPRD